MALFACLLAVSLVRAGADELLVDDFEGGGRTWRSKFSTHAVRDTDRDGAPTKALETPYDFRSGPTYLWVRAICDPPLDVRPFTYLSFRFRGDGSGQQVTPVLINVVGEGEERREEGASSDRSVVLDFEGWRQFSVPLDTFGASAEMLGAVQQVNFSLESRAAPPQPRSLWLDDVKFVGPNPLGQLIEESVPFPPADIAVTSDQALLDAMNLSRPELQDVKAAADRGDLQAAKRAWAAHLESRKTPRWLWSRFDPDALVAAHEQHFGGLARYAPSADLVLARDFNWLGVRKKLDHDIEWLQGPTEWTHVLSRFGYWQTLGKAYWGTGDSKYAEDFVYTLHDWIADNPVPRILTNSRGKRGTVWRTLETGIRGDVWFDAMEMFMCAPEFDADAKWEMTRSLVEHARHLHRYEVEFRYGNWQVVECTGLACIGIMLPEFQEAEGWRQRAFQYLVEHMQRDVLDDGAHYEVTPGYHAWVMTLFLRAALLAQRNGYEVPGLMAKHERMFEFLLHLSRPNRHTPSVGDAGGPAGPDISGSMGLGALLYNRPDMRYLAVDKPEESWLWLFGEEAIERYATMPKSPPTFTSSYLPNALYFALRTGWEPQDYYLLFDCAPWGGGHSHADRLSVAAYALGQDLVIDPGMYSYDEPLSSQYLRFGRAHNVLLIDDGDQPNADPAALAHDFTEGFDFVCGRLTDAKRGLIQTRSVLFVRPTYWVIVDHVEGAGSHHLQQLFHLPLGAAVDLSGVRAVVTLKEGVTFVLEAVGPAGVSGKLLEGWVPTGGATAEKAPVVAFECDAELPTSLAVLLYPLKDVKAEQVAIASVPSEGDRLSLKVTRPGASETLTFAAEPQPMSLPDATVTTRATCLAGRDTGRVVYAAP
jgi:hypothetical protein